MFPHTCVKVTTCCVVTVVGIFWYDCWTWPKRQNETDLTIQKVTGTVVYSLVVLRRRAGGHKILHCGGRKS